MASLATHFTASLLLCPLGVRRLLCSVSLFLKNPSMYRSRVWYFSEPKSKNIDLHALLISLPIASLSHVLIYLAFSESATYRFSFLQQSLVVFLFWAILVLIILNESSDLFSVPENLVFISAGIAFLVESYMCGMGVIGLGAWVYGILTGLDIFCAACCVYLSIRPSRFSAEFLLSSGIVLKGTWVLQVGLSLYTDAFGFKGCDKISGLTLGKGMVDVKCELEDDMWRGMALMSLLFLGHVIVVMITSLVLFGLLSRFTSMRCGGTSGHSLSELGSESMLMRSLSELELE